MDVRVGDVYRVGRRIGSGTFGDVYIGVHVETQAEVAIKVEVRYAADGQLAHELKVYDVLKGENGFAQVFWHGQLYQSDAAILTLLGPTLEEAKAARGNKLKTESVMLIAAQMIDRLQSLHARGFIHRDIKPDNFCIGRGSDRSTVFLIDFGLAKSYWDHQKQKHIRYREGKSMTGTARYASIGCHLGIEQSRRDDLQSLGYCLVYLLRGSLPWQAIQAATKKQKNEFILQRKMETALADLCKGLPKAILTYLQRCLALRFDEVPDYASLRNMFHSGLSQATLDLNIRADCSPLESCDASSPERSLLIRN